MAEIYDYETDPQPGDLSYDEAERADAIVRAITSCTHPDAANGAHAYRDGICRCGAAKRNPDGSVPDYAETEL